MKRLSLLLIACFITSFLFADNGIGLSNTYQKDKKRSRQFDKTRLIVGGGLGFVGLQGGYFFSVSPSIGYRITERFHAGVNLGYSYSKSKIPYDNLGSYEEYRNRIITTSLYARFFPLDVVFLQASPELNFVNQKYENYYALQDRTTNDKLQLTSPSFLVGGGYAQRLGGGSYMMISVMYDLVRDPNSPYRNQTFIFGGGLALGLFGR